jgi:hypothetical protein
VARRRTISEAVKLRRALEQLRKLDIPKYLHAMGCGVTAIKVEQIFKRIK